MPAAYRAAALAALRELGTSPNPPQSPSWEKFSIKSYQQGFIYILDHSLDYLQRPNRSLKQQQHDDRCMRMANFFDSRTPYEVKLVNPSTEDEWVNFWDAELASKTADDLLIVYFHGNASNCNMGYKWHFQRGLKINAHNFISKIQGGITDCTFFLDCPFYDRMTFGLKWKLEDAAMIEFITSPVSVQNNNGTSVDHEGDWSKAFVRNMVGFMEGDVQSPKLRVPVKSIPQAMAKDHTIPRNQGSRFKLTRRKKDRRVIRRLIFDPVKLWCTGEYQFFGKEYRPRKAKKDPENEDEVEGEEHLPEDEGVDEDFDAAAQFVLDQLNRAADIADGFGDDGVDHFADED